MAETMNVKKGQMGLLLNVLSLTRTQLASSLLDGKKRDIDAECGYPTEITADLYRKMFEREGVAARVVQCLPEECWSAPPEVYETEDPDITEFEDAWNQLEKRLRIFHYLYRADVLSGIGRFGIILLGLGDGKALSEPVEGINERGERVGGAQNELLFLKVFDESVVQVASKENDPTNPRYGHPTTYTVTFEDVLGSSTNITTQKVHWTRVIHLADGRQMSEVYGTPRMRSVYNRLLDVRKILASSGEMFWKGGFPGYSFELPPALADAGVEIDAESLREEMEKYSNGLQRYLAVTGVSVKPLAPQVSDPTKHVEAQLKAIAISLSTPYRILFGSEQAQLASSQDARNWARRLKNRQENYLTPMVIRPFIDRLIALGILPEVEEYHVQWPDLYTPSEMEKAELSLKRTEGLAKYIEGGVDQLMPPRSFLGQVMGFSPEEIDAIEEEAKAYQEEGFEQGNIGGEEEVA